MSPTEEAAAVEAVVLRGLGLPSAAARVVRADGELRGAPVTLEARIRDVGRVVVVEGQGVAFANLLFAAPPDRAAPVLGIDLVALGESTLVAADLTPVLPPRTPEHDAQTDTLALLRARHSALPSAGPLSPPYDTLLSPHCIHARVTTGAEAGLTRACLRDLAETFVTFAKAPPRPDLAPAATAGLSSYMAGHRQDLRILSVLTRAFGPTFATPFVREVLFPLP